MHSSENFSNNKLVLGWQRMRKKKSQLEHGMTHRCLSRNHALEATRGQPCLGTQSSGPCCTGQAETTHINGVRKDGKYAQRQANRFEHGGRAYARVYSHAPATNRLAASDHKGPLWCSAQQLFGLGPRQTRPQPCGHGLGIDLIYHN